jgi:hypothetical protein
MNTDKEIEFAQKFLNDHHAQMMDDLPAKYARKLPFIMTSFVNAYKAEQIRDALTDHYEQQFNKRVAFSAKWQGQPATEEPTKSAWEQKAEEYQARQRAIDQREQENRIAFNQDDSKII